MAQLASRVSWALGLLVALCSIFQLASAKDIEPVVLLHATPDVLNPHGILSDGEGATRLRISDSQRQWPEGTTAYASSTRRPAGLADSWRTYEPSNVIDGRVDTFWSDAIEESTKGPSSIIIDSPYPIILSSISVVFEVDGVAAAFFVETSEDKSSWARRGSVERNHEVICVVEWKPIVVRYVRLTFPRPESLTRGRYTRVAHVYPGRFLAADHWPKGTTASISNGAISRLSPRSMPYHSHRSNLASQWPRTSDLAVVEISSPETIILPGITIFFDIHPVPFHFSNIKIEYAETLEPSRWSLVEDLNIRAKTLTRRVRGEIDERKSLYNLEFLHSISMKKLRITLLRVPRAADSWPHLHSLDILPHIRPNHTPKLSRDMTEKTFLDVDFGRVVFGFLHYTVSAVSYPPPSLHVTLAKSLDEFSSSDLSIDSGRTSDDSVPALMGTIESVDAPQSFRYMRIYLSDRPEDADEERWIELSRLWVNAHPDLLTSYRIASFDFEDDGRERKLVSNGLENSGVDTSKFLEGTGSEGHPASVTEGGENTLESWSEMRKQWVANDCGVNRLPGRERVWPTKGERILPWPPVAKRLFRVTSPDCRTPIYEDEHHSSMVIHCVSPNEDVEGFHDETNYDSTPVGHSSYPLYW